MLSPLPAVSCGCDRAVAAQDSWAAVLLLRLWVSAPWLAGVPHLTLPHAIRAHCAALPLLGSAICCCLGLSCSFLSVFHFLKGNRLTILYQNQHFGLFIPLGEKILFLLQLEQSAALRLGRRQSLELEVLKITGARWPLQTQHISLVPLSVTGFLRRGSRFQLKPEVSRAGGGQGTASDRTETREAA